MKGLGKMLVAKAVAKMTGEKGRRGSKRKKKKKTAYEKQTEERGQRISDKEMRQSFLRSLK